MIGSLPITEEPIVKPLVVKLLVVKPLIVMAFIKEGSSMSQDERCCGSGTCIINAEGLCWCGQRWVGNLLCQPNQTQEVQSVQDSLEPNKEA